ncbi:hypothetical protein EDB80DRAFT_688366 [Ilyonectria destructans]|nr:hypothetical protein EDB80DRAFT_688366 [Ilyonectria destructans]
MYHSPGPSCVCSSWDVFWTPLAFPSIRHGSHPALVFAGLRAPPWFPVPFASSSLLLCSSLVESRAALARQGWLRATGVREQDHHIIFSWTDDGGYGGMLFGTGFILDLLVLNLGILDGKMPQITMIPANSAVEGEALETGPASPKSTVWSTGQRMAPQI